MTEERVEQVFGPVYFRKFVCDGKACGSLCCGGWHIPVDPLARKRFESLSDPARDDIFGKLSEKESGWEMRHGEEGNCAFLDGDGLCSLQKEHGEELLPDVCYSFPRVTYRFSGFAERALSVSCPVAALIVLPPSEPLPIEMREEPALRPSAAIRPPMEALRWEAALPSIQLRAVSFLQDRELTLWQRLLRLGRFLASLEARCGKESPDEEALRLCALEAESGEKSAPRAETMPRLRYMAALTAALYEAEYPADRLEALACQVAGVEAEAEKEIHKRYGHILENLAVNEFFLRLYPFACGGGLLANFKLFALRFRLAEFSLLLSATAENAVPDEETVLAMLGRVMERLDHSRAADDFLRECVASDMRGLSAERVISLL